jgi:hypothetical protein
MGILQTRSTDTPPGGNALTDDIPAGAPEPTTFPLMLMMRLRLHAMWLLFILIPS